MEFEKSKKKKKEEKKKKKRKKKRGAPKDLTRMTHPTGWGTPTGNLWKVLDFSSAIKEWHGFVSLKKTLRGICIC
jgi:hypothetical protein